MTRTSDFKSYPTGLTAEGYDRYAGPENNGIDPHNVQGTRFETTDSDNVDETPDYGLLEVSTPSETIDQTDPVGDTELKYSRARSQKNDGLPLDEVAEPEKNEAAPAAEDETASNSDSRENAPTGPGDGAAPALPPVEHETGNEQDVTIETETAQLQDDSNESPEDGPAVQPEDAGTDGTSGNENPVSGQTDGQDGVADTSTEAPEDQGGSEEGYPEGNPTNAWRVGQIDAWAADQNPPVEFPEGSTKNQKLAIIKNPEN